MTFFAGGEHLKGSCVSCRWLRRDPIGWEAGKGEVGGLIFTRVETLAVSRITGGGKVRTWALLTGLKCSSITIMRLAATRLIPTDPAWVLSRNTCRIVTKQPVSLLQNVRAVSLLSARSQISLCSPGAAMHGKG